MIATNKKIKPRQGLAHPIGAKQISESLSNIPIYEQLNIDFEKEEGNRMGLFVPDSPMQKLNGNSRELLDFRELVIGFYSSQLNRWKIIIRPVPNQHKRFVNEFLNKIGIPRLRSWFIAEKDETWFEGKRFYQIGLSNDLNKYYILETQNEHIILKQTNTILL